ncbi:hypothetical protein EV378_5341 [Pseudonocardia endophytica]|uniref:Excreted virulence factor EspC (Type VII ESX diderm) n=2 Tax=Pseudonocardia endophytica TaxID=401976 RepID=A0A4R1HNT5_PSEEN|nr:hypothetical protein EV378_5341 [Pseudonocardia endophytica]
MLQVSRDNVLAVHRAFQDHADDLRAYLLDVGVNSALGLCGGDPVSRAAVGPQSFGGKIDQLLDVHWKHWEELDAVAGELREAARTYGHAEDEIQRSLAAKPTR